MLRHSISLPIQFFAYLLINKSVAMACETIMSIRRANDAQHIFSLFKYLEDSNKKSETEGLDTPAETRKEEKETKSEEFEEIEKPFKIDKSNFQYYCEKAKTNSLSGLSCESLVQFKQVFEDFKKQEQITCKSEETPLGQYILRKKEDELLKLSVFDLEQLVDMTTYENKLIQLQNYVFFEFLKKNDPRFDPENEIIQSMMEMEDVGELCHEIILSSKGGSRPENFITKKDTSSSKANSEMVRAFLKTVENEIHEKHKKYENDIIEHSDRIRDLNSAKKCFELYLIKIEETSAVMKNMVLKKHPKKKNKYLSDPKSFYEFLKVVIRQDKEDIRRLNVMTFEIQKERKSLLKEVKYKDPITKVDIDMQEIVAEQMKKKLVKKNAEFLELKSIYDTFQKKINDCRDEESKKRKAIELQRQKLSKLIKHLNDLKITQKSRKSTKKGTAERRFI